MFRKCGRASALALGFVAVLLLLQCSDLNPLLLSESYRGFLHQLADRYPKLPISVFLGSFCYLAVLRGCLESKRTRGRKSI